MNSPNATPDFFPHPLLRNGHAMTIAPALIPRKSDKTFKLAEQERFFQVEPDTRLLAHCHFHPDAHERATLVLLHGLEGSSQSSHVLELARKAYYRGMNAVRVNLRNCGGTLHLTPTLYNGGLSGDLINILKELKQEGFKNLFAVGISLGGNIVLKATGELGLQGSDLLKGVAAVSPAIDLQVSVSAIERPINRLYEWWFLRTLKEKIRQKELLFPGRLDIERLDSVRTIRQFDDVYTAPSGGYGRADEYYDKASSLRVIHKVAIPTLIIAAEDDPLVPYSMFEQPQLEHPQIELISTQYGGHAGFIHCHALDSLDRFWAENRIVSFCIDHQS